MKTPNLPLMRAYGNEEVFFQKTAGSPLAKREFLIMEARAELERLEELKTLKLHLEAQRLNARARLMELAKMAPAIENAYHTRVPIIIGGGPRVRGEELGFGSFGDQDYGPAAAGIPAGMTEGMIRMASVIGSTMAKQANTPYRTPGSVAETNPAVTTAVAPAAAEAGEPWLHPKTKARLQKFWDTKGGLAGKTLGMRNAVVKPLALAGTAAGLYAGYKGLQKGLNWLGTEARTPTYNAGGNQLASDVNEHGQAQLRLPQAYY